MSIIVDDFVLCTYAVSPPVHPDDEIVLKKGAIYRAIYKPDVTPHNDFVSVPGMYFRLDVCRFVKLSTLLTVGDEPHESAL